MKARFRTSAESWGVLDYPVILVDEASNGFILTAYTSTAMAEIKSPVSGIYDVMEFELFYENND